MPALPSSQQLDWNDNIYILATTGILPVIGMAYLIKIMYGLMPFMCGRRTAPVAQDGLELANTVSNLPVMVPGAVDMGPDLEAGLTLDVQRLQPTYDPRNHTERSWTNSPTQRQSAEISGQSPAVQTIAEHDVDLRNHDRHIEEDTVITIGITGQETMGGSAADDGIGEPATPPPEDTILPSPDA